jgi:hypothetical protein
MTMFSKKTPTETRLKKEHILSKGFFARFLHSFLNNIFSLRPEKIKKRGRNLLLLFSVSWLLLILFHYPLSMWIQGLRDVYLFLFSPATDMNYVDVNPYARFFTLIFEAATNARTVQYVLLFFVSFFIAMRLAAIYLADVFELDDVEVAQRFIFQLALVGSEETILIKQGEIAEQHRYTIVYLLGGPGKVIVDNDSVALFERADGTPHLIGPTGKEPDGKATIEGFERFRQAINIRDQWGEFNDKDFRSAAVMTRSRDGIPFGATDVDFVYSVYRGENTKPSPDVPFPFSKDAVENLIYKSRSRVVSGLPFTSIYEFSWTNNLLGQVRGKCSDFMSSRNLTEHLHHIVSTFKPPDSNDEVAQNGEDSNIFAYFNDEFKERSRELGTELHWLGVGTWKLPAIVSEVQMEAQKIKEENIESNNEDAIKNAEIEGFLETMEALIEYVPIGAYYDRLNRELSNFVGELNYQKIINGLLLDYRNQLVVLHNIIVGRGRTINPVIKDAIGYIDSQLAEPNASEQS